MSRIAAWKFLLKSDKSLDSGADNGRNLQLVEVRPALLKML